MASASAFESAVERVDVEENELHVSLLSQIPEMVEKFMKMVDSESAGESSSADWNLMTQQDSNPPLTIHQSPQSAHKYRINAVLDNSAESVFDFLMDVERRPTWDDLMEESRIIAQLNDFTRVIYVKLKGIWPTTSRDMVLLSHCCRKESVLNGIVSYTYVNVTKTIEYPGVPTPEEKGTVRMISPLAGQLVSSHGPKSCTLLQLADGDPRGWIPVSVIKFVMTQALPLSITKLNGLLSDIPTKKQSIYITGAKDSTCTTSASSRTGAQPSSSSSTPARQVVSTKSEKLGKMASVSRSRNPAFSVFQSIHVGLVATSPWMVAVIFGITVYRFVRR